MLPGRTITRKVIFTVRTVYEESQDIMSPLLNQLCLMIAVTALLLKSSPLQRKSSLQANLSRPLLARASRKQNVSGGEASCLAAVPTVPLLSYPAPRGCDDG